MGKGNREMHRTQKNDKAARCVSPSLYSIVKVQELESRVHRKMQALVREGVDGNVPQGNAPATYFTTYPGLPSCSLLWHLRTNGIIVGSVKGDCKPPAFMRGFMTYPI